ncbi:MAG: ribosome silencing factor [Myxococcales bacterium]|nr:ribosome silencing factor [Myxococcales bacterium]
MNKPAPTREALPDALKAALDAALDLKALAPKILHVTEVAGYTDYVLLLSGRSDRHVRGITEAIVDALRKVGRRPLGTDGLDQHLWDLLDYDDFIIHIFYHPVREYYDLESMWSDAPRVELDLPAEVMDVSGLGHLPPPDVMPGQRGVEFAAFEGELDAADEDLEGYDDFDDSDLDDAEFDDDDDDFDEADFDEADFDDDDDFADDDEADDAAEDAATDDPGRRRKVP